MNRTSFIRKKSDTTQKLSLLNSNKYVTNEV